MLVDKLEHPIFFAFVGLHIPHLQRASFDDMGCFFSFVGAGWGGWGVNDPWI
jgi:hypothetical protein